MPRPSRLEAISKIAVGGFKSIVHKQEIELRPLTLLAGANSSGKSSIMQPLLLMKQTLESPSDPGTFRLDGPNVLFTRSEQLLSRIPGRTEGSDFFICLHLDENESLKVIYHRRKSGGFEIKQTIYKIHDVVIDFSPNMAPDEIKSNLSIEALKYLELESDSYKSTGLQVYQDRCFSWLGIQIRIEDDPMPKKLEVFTPSRLFLDHIIRLIHLPGLRGNPARTYQRSGVGPDFPGTFESYVASIIAEWQKSKDKKLITMGEALAELGLTWKVSAEPLDDTKVELRVGRLPHSTRGGARDLVSIADVGFGVSQVLPVVVALVVAQPGQIVYLEQPEIHLHPNAQRRLAHLLKDAALRRCIIVAETHSALLLREIQTLVATGALPPEIVKLHWFERLESGETKITPTDLDKNGAFGSWPEDFDNVDLESQRAYLDAVESKLSKEV